MIITWLGIVSRLMLIGVFVYGARLVGFEPSSHKNKK